MKRLRAALVAALLAGALALTYENVREVPVLMYHRIGYDTDHPNPTVTPETFEMQMEFLRAHHYRVVSLSSLMEDLARGRRVPWNTVAITFDDGTVDNFNYAFPVLKRAGFPATIFMITRNVNEPGWLSEEDLRILDESGIEIGSHTVTHAFLPKEPSPAAVRFEIEASKRRLERILGHDVRLFSYPAGGVTVGIREAVKKAGYAGAATTNYGRSRHDPYALRRIKISERNRNLFAFWAKVSGLYSVGKKRIPVN